MHILFVILIILAGLIAIMLLLALLTKSAYSIQREVTIGQPVQQVFGYVRLIRNQEVYSQWLMQDPTNKISYSGTDGRVGFVSEWEGEKQAGKGAQEIIGLTADSSIKLELRFEKPFKNLAYTEMTTAATGNNQTLVTWKMYGNNKFPMTLFNLVADGLLGKDMEKSLSNLKRILEMPTSDQTTANQLNN